MKRQKRNYLMRYRHVSVDRHCYMYDGRITDFKTFKTSDYLSDVYADARGTYLKFEVK